MHGWMAFTVGLGILLSSAGAAWAQAERPSPNMLVLSAPSGGRAAPTILRGTPAAQPAAAPAAAEGGWQIVGGERLWLVDRDTGELRGCINRQTSTVGLRVIECTSRELGRFRRTFGPNFNP